MPNSSQANTTFMQAMAHELEATGGLDVLVDDGGHFMNEQFSTWNILWPTIR